MKERNRIKKNIEWNEMIQSNKQPYRNRYFVIYCKKHDKFPYRFGLSVSTKLGNAVFRNKIKRQLRNIINEVTFQKSFDCLIIVRKAFSDLSYQEKEKTLRKSLTDLKLIDGGKDEEKNTEIISN